MRLKGPKVELIEIQKQINLTDKILRMEEARIPVIKMAQSLEVSMQTMFYWRRKLNLYRNKKYERKTD